MQNKGFIKTFTIILALISIFHISFTVVGRHFDNQAEEYSKGDLVLKNHYLDSLATEEIYLGKTLKEIREKEIGLGLDLKGGMTVMLEVDAAQVLSTLANTDDQYFLKALDQTIKDNKSGTSSDFVSLFGQNYQKISPEGKLANIFSITMRDRVKIGDSNADVMKVLAAEVSDAADNSFRILKTRIDQFGVVAPNIQRLDRAERVLMELPGVTEPDRVRKLLQGSANLEFWKTYKAKELNTYFSDLNSKSSQYIGKLDSINGEKPFKITKSFTEYFNTPYFINNNYNGSVVGVASKVDTASINYLLTKYKDIFPSDVSFKWGFKPTDSKETYFELFALKGDGIKKGPALTGDVILSAHADQGGANSGSAWEVGMTMNSTGTSRWSTITGAEIGRSIAILLDGAVYSAPNVQSKIDGGTSSITGNFSADEAKDLVNVLKSGKMKAGVKIVQEDVVGPSLGKESIKAGFVSFVIALLVLFVIMCLLYGFASGMVANCALILNFFFMIGVLAAFQAVLTLPGIAGIILALGMAVDANVLILERIKEEISGGKSVRKSVEEGYKNAFSAIIDANLTSIITGVILAYFGTGPIRGFAITLIIGISISFLTAVFLTRMFYEYMLNKGKWENLNFTTAIYRTIFSSYNINFLSLSKKIVIGIALFLVISTASFFVLKLNAGIDFTGGRNFIVKFDNPVKTSEIQEALVPKFGESVRVITIGSENQVRISTNFVIDSDKPDVEKEYVNMIGESLKSYMGKGETIEQCLQSTQKVGPSVAKDTLQGAFKALFYAFLCLGLYIFIRFHNWSFSIGTVVALIIDSFAIVGCYSLLWKIMPFSLEIDQTFVAAVLTIIGYSLNDKVVVFDRVREFITLYPKRDLRSLFNDSLNATLTRTINTTLCTLSVVVCILIFGGPSIRSFVFAMFIGIIIGTLTSLFIATPIAYKVMVKQRNKITLEKSK